MSAFNWISFSARCPCCGAHGELRAQCHVASSYGGVEGGPRFHDADYRLGQEMAWWPRGSAMWASWREDASVADDAGDTAVEACYASCGRCDGALFAVLRFVDLVPRDVLDVGREEDWPARYPR